MARLLVKGKESNLPLKASYLLLSRYPGKMSSRLSLLNACDPLSASALPPVWVCQKVMLTGSPNFTAGALLGAVVLGAPQAASAGSTASAPAAPVVRVRNFRREIAMW